VTGFINATGHHSGAGPRPSLPGGLPAGGGFHLGRHRILADDFTFEAERRRRTCCWIARGAELDAVLAANDG
jgi:hypothetical protein